MCSSACRVDEPKSCPGTDTGQGWLCKPNLTVSLNQSGHYTPKIHRHDSIGRQWIITQVKVLCVNHNLLQGNQRGQAWGERGSYSFGPSAPRREVHLWSDIGVKYTWHPASELHQGTLLGSVQHECGSLRYSSEGGTEKVAGAESAHEKSTSRCWLWLSQIKLQTSHAFCRTLNREACTRFGARGGPLFTLIIETTSDATAR